MSFHNQYFILIIKNKFFDQEEKMRYCYICFFFQGTEKELIKLVYLTYSILPDDAVFNMIVFGERMLSFPFFFIFVIYIPEGKLSREDSDEPSLL